MAHRRFRLPQISLFDKTGLDHHAIRLLNGIIYAFVAGMGWVVITSGVALTGFFKELGASDAIYGLLVALNPIASSLQFLTSYALERWLPRKKTFIIAGLIQRSVWLPMGLIPFIIPMELQALRLWMAATLLTLSAGMNPIMNVAFSSMCADAVPLRIRGRYFSVRSRITLFSGLVFGLLTGYVLDNVPGFASYAIMFGIASVLGIADIGTFIFLRFPPMRRHPHKLGLIAMMKPIFQDRNYMRLVRFGTAWAFAVNLFSPFSMVYLIEGMKMPRFQIVLYNLVASNLTGMIAAGWWGRAFDRIGIKPVLTIITLFMAGTSLLWAIAMPGMAWVILVVSCLGGMVWSAYDIGGQNLYMKLAGEQNRSMYFAIYFIGVQLLGVALSSAIGGWLLDNPLAHIESLGLHLGGYRPTRYHYLFYISGALRFAAIGLLPSVKEEGAPPVRAAFADMMASTRASFVNLLGNARAALTKLSRTRST